jgi:hypothetical protein
MPDRYWIATSEGNWNDNANWSTTDGGAGGSSFPTLSDDAYFTSTSNGDCTINLSTIACNNLVFTDQDPAISTTGYTGNLNALTQYTVYGNYCWFSSTMTRSGAGTILFKATGDVSLNCGVPFIGPINVTLSSVYDSVIPRDDMVYEYASGSFFQIQVGYVDFTIFNTKCTFNDAGDIQIIRILSSSEYAIKFYDLEKTGGGGLYFRKEGVAFSDTSKQKILVANNLTLKGTSDADRFIFAGGAASSAGNPYPCISSMYNGVVRLGIEVEGTVDVDYIIIRGVVNAGTTWDLTSVEAGDGNFNDGINFTASRTSYYVGGASAGNLGDDKWKSTSGGATSVRIPLPQDDCRIDANSFTGAQTLTHNLTVLPKINFTGSSSVTFAVGSNNVYCAYDLNFTDLSAFSGTRELWFEKTGNQNVICSSFSNIIRINNPDVVVQLSDDFVSTNYLVVDHGEFDANGYDVTCSGLNSFSTNTRTIKMGSGTWIITGATAAPTSSNQAFNLNNITNLTWNAGTSMVKFTGAPGGSTYIFAGGTTGLAFYNFENAQSGGAGRFVFRGDNCSFNNFKINAGVSQYFWRGYTFTVNSFNAVGTGASGIVIQSDTTSAFNIVKSGGGVINTANYCTISYSDASPASTWYAGKNSTDGGNNSGWIFKNAPVFYDKTLTGDVVRLAEPSVGIKIPKRCLKDSVVLFDSDVKKNSKVVSEEIVLSARLEKGLPDLGLSDVVSLVDVVGKNTGKSVSDFFVLDEDFSKKYDGVRVFSDSPVLFDSDFKKNSKSFGDAVSLGDVVNKKFSITIVAHCPTLSDDMSLSVGKLLDDVVVLDDVVSKKYDGVRFFSDDVSLNDFIIKDNEIHLTDELVLDDKITKLVEKKAFVDSYSLSDVLDDFSIRKNLFDEVTLFDSDVKHFSKVLSDSPVLKEFLSGGSFINLIDHVKLDDVVNKFSSVNFSDDISLSDVVDKKTGLSFSDVIVLDDLLIKKPVKDLLDEIVLDEELSKKYDGNRSFSDEIVLDDSVLRNTSRLFSDEVVLDDSVFKLAGKDLKDEIVLDDFVFKYSKRFFDDKIDILDSDNRHTMKRLKDFFSLRDFVFKKPLKNLKDVISLNDLLVKKTSLVKKDELVLDEVLTKFISKKPFDDEVVLDDSVNKKTSKKPFEDKVSLVDLTVLPKLKPTIRGMQKDFIDILHDIPAAEYVDWIRYGETEDEMGRLKTDETLWTNIIYVILQPLTEKDRSFLPQGLEVSSYMKAYTEPRYYFNNQRLEVEVGDVFVRSDGHKYMVETIAGKYGNFKAQVYRKLLLRGIDND